MKRRDFMKYTTQEPYFCIKYNKKILIKIVNKIIIKMIYNLIKTALKNPSKIHYMYNKYIAELNFKVGGIA